jgi:hypothetical protein
MPQNGAFPRHPMVIPFSPIRRASPSIQGVQGRLESWYHRVGFMWPWCLEVEADVAPVGFVLHEPRIESAPQS